MEIILTIATILGGIAAIWFFWDKTRTVDWSRIRLTRAKLAVSKKDELVIDRPAECSSSSADFPKTFEPEFPLIVREYIAEYFSEYHLPLARDIHGDWALFGNPDTQFPVLCFGDFFGNGKPDYATFVLKNDKPRWQVVVIPNQNAKRRTPITLANGDGMPQNMYIRTVKPGSYRPINDKGYSTSDAEGRKVLKLRRDGINLGTFESADAIYYWDKPKRQFIEVWMSD